MRERHRTRWHTHHERLPRRGDQVTEDNRLRVESSDDYTHAQGWSGYHNTASHGDRRKRYDDSGVSGVGRSEGTWIGERGTECGRVGGRGVLELMSGVVEYMYLSCLWKSRGYSSLLWVMWIDGSVVLTLVWGRRWGVGSQRVIMVSLSMVVVCDSTGWRYMSVEVVCESGLQRRRRDSGVM
ncbi:hypothetical protein Tco_1569717 [Tanacetum coccineum]